MTFGYPNILAVVLSAIIYLILGWIWYSDALFGKVIASCVNNKDKKCCMPCASKYIVSFIIAFVMAFILGMFIQTTNAMTTGDAIKVAVIIWLGFSVATELLGVVWEGIKIKAFFVDIIFALIWFVITGAIIGSWH